MPSKSGSDGHSQSWYLAEKAWLDHQELQAGEGVETYKHVRWVFFFKCGCFKFSSREMANSSGEQDFFNGNQVKTTPAAEIPKLA